MLTAPEAMATPTSKIEVPFIIISWPNLAGDEIDCKWSTRSRRFSYTNPEDNMENDFTTRGE
jgi:hypothetical protein